MACKHKFVKIARDGWICKVCARSTKRNPKKRIPATRGGLPKYVVLVETHRGGPILMTNIVDVPLRFDTPDDAREAARGAMWEQKLCWWIVPLTPGGAVIDGLDLALA